MKQNSAELEARKIKRVLDAQLRSMRDKVLERASEIKGRPVELSSLHGIIGSKNDIYADPIRDQFTDSEDFLATWVRGLCVSVKEAENRQLRFEGKVNSNETAAQRLADLLQDRLIRRYTLLFLKRNFYREFNARTRQKPPDDLWQIWFGSNKLFYGMLISPAYRNGAWTNDKSEMRRAPYVYWTIGHVMATGLVSPDEDLPMTFSSVDDFLTFYRHVLKQIANSQYEKAIASLYLKYLGKSPDVLSEPLLVPEFRYGGLKAAHEYRVDYTVFNGHTMSRTGFELSPHSTHGALTRVKKKTVAALNAELKATWEREMTKRNSYFERYALPIVTFTDSHLGDMNDCFKRIESALSDRAAGRLVLSEELKLLQAVYK